MNRITEFVDSFIPKNIPKKKALILKAELTCHILDKVDYYKDIGYDENEGINKAIGDFGTDEEVRNNIFNEFEELYSEKSIFGIMAFVIIGVMNFLCLPLDVWVTSADFNRNPEPVGAFISFCMIFVVFLMISVARVKKYRNTLISIGIINTLIAVVLLFSFYPQMAAYTVGYNLIYLIDHFTPVSMGDTIVMGHDVIIVMVLWLVYLIIPAVYCFVEAVRIKKGTANTIKRPKKKIAIFSAVFFAVAIVSCLMYPASEKYINNYPVWFNNYHSYISEDSEKKYNEIILGYDYNQVGKHLSFEGYVPVEAYRNSLDILTQKQFDDNLDEFSFAQGYEIWFNPDKRTDGNSFVGIRSDNGIVTGVGIGNMEDAMYTGEYSNFGYSDLDTDDDMAAATAYFRALHKGDSEDDVMSSFGVEYGTTYSKRKYLENGTEKSYYRIYCYKDSFDLHNSPRYIELLFENGRLASATMYDKVYLDEGTTVLTESVK